jgi:hypothetical protein
MGEGLRAWSWGSKRLWYERVQTGGPGGCGHTGGDIEADYQVNQGMEVVEGLTKARTAVDLLRRPHQERAAGVLQGGQAALNFWCPREEELAGGWLAEGSG